MRDQNRLLSLFKDLVSLQLNQYLSWKEGSTMLFLSSYYWCVNLKRAESVIWIKKIKIKLPISLKLQELNYFLSKAKKIILVRNIVKLKFSSAVKNIFSNLNLYSQFLQTKYRYSSYTLHQFGYFKIWAIAYRLHKRRILIMNMNHEFKRYFQ